MSNRPFHRICVLVALGAALLAGCATAPVPTDSRPLNTLYRCDRNGDLEQRQAC